MKRVKKFILMLLLFAFLILCSSCNINYSEQNRNEKWVAYKDECIVFDIYGNEYSKQISRNSYDYNGDLLVNETVKTVFYEQGKLQSELFLVENEYEYDNDNKLTCRKTKTIADDMEELYETKYTFNENGQCIKSTVIRSSSTVESVYEYDNKGDLVYREDYEFLGDEVKKCIYKYDSIYENDLLIRKKETIVSLDTQSETQFLYEFEYDKHGNIVKLYQFLKSDDINNKENCIEYNGENYCLRYIKNSKYKKIKLNNSH